MHIEQEILGAIYEVLESTTIPITKLPGGLVIEFKFEREHAQQLASEIFKNIRALQAAILKRGSNTGIVRGMVPDAAPYACWSSFFDSKWSPNLDECSDAVKKNGIDERDA